jgi:hypothetical protein
MFWITCLYFVGVEFRRKGSLSCVASPLPAGNYHHMCLIVSVLKKRQDFKNLLENTPWKRTVKNVHQGTYWTQTNEKGSIAWHIFVHNCTLHCIFPETVQFCGHCLIGSVPFFSQCIWSVTLYSKICIWNNICFSDDLLLAVKAIINNRGTPDLASPYAHNS